MICHECNSNMKESQEVYHYTESGLDNVYLGNICMHRCKCGESFPSIHNIIELNTVIGREIVKKPTSLDGREIVFLRKNVGLNAKTFADYLGIDKSTLSRWENNQQIIAKSNDRFIRLIYATLKGLPGEDIDNLLKEAAKDFNKSKYGEKINISMDSICSQIECRT